MKHVLDKIFKYAQDPGDKYIKTRHKNIPKCNINLVYHKICEGCGIDEIQKPPKA